MRWIMSTWVWKKCLDWRSIRYIIIQRLHIWYKYFSWYTMYQSHDFQRWTFFTSYWNQHGYKWYNQWKFLQTPPRFVNYNGIILAGKYSNCHEPFLDCDITTFDSLPNYYLLLSTRYVQLADRYLQTPLLFYGICFAHDKSTVISVSMCRTLSVRIIKKKHVMKLSVFHTHFLSYRLFF